MSQKGFDFHFVYTLTFLHTLVRMAAGHSLAGARTRRLQRCGVQVTLGGMLLFSACGMFKRKAVPAAQVVPCGLQPRSSGLEAQTPWIWDLKTPLDLLQVLPLAGAFVGYIVRRTPCSTRCAVPEERARAPPRRAGAVERLPPRQLGRLLPAVQGHDHARRAPRATWGCGQAAPQPPHAADGACLQEWSSCRHYSFARRAPAQRMT